MQISYSCKVNDAVDLDHIILCLLFVQYSAPAAEEEQVWSYYLCGVVCLASVASYALHGSPKFVL